MNSKYSHSFAIYVRSFIALLCLLQFGSTAIAQNKIHAITRASHIPCPTCNGQGYVGTGVWYLRREDKSTRTVLTVVDLDICGTCNVVGWVPSKSWKGSASVPFLSAKRDFFPPAVTSYVKSQGNAYGCHSCGTSVSGVKTWVRDHKRPFSLTMINTMNKPGWFVCYPHCITCSNTQGGKVGYCVLMMRTAPVEIPNGILRYSDSLALNMHQSSFVTVVNDLITARFVYYPLNHI